MVDNMTGVLSNMQGALGQYQNPQMAADVTNGAYQLGNTLQQNASIGASQIGQGGGAQIAQNALGNQFDFAPVGQQLTQTTQLAQDMAGRARTQAADASALNMRQSEGALDAQLAGRGLSMNSGAAAAGLMGLQQQNALARSQLEGNLANQAGQMGLQAAQLDTSNLLQHQGTASQYNLGMNQLGAQTGLALQQLNDQQAIQRTGMLNDAAMGGFNALQGTYAQNYLNPQLQIQSILGALSGQLAGIGAGGLQANTELGARGVQQAGSGKGAALGSVTNNLMNYQSKIPNASNGSSLNMTGGQSVNQRYTQ